MPKNSSTADLSHHNGQVSVSLNNRRVLAKGTFRLILSVASLAAVTPAVAWNNHGHMLVAAVAWQHLSPHSRDRVAELMKINPDYKRLMNGAASGGEAQFAFIRAATWPDMIKVENGYVNDGESPPGPEVPSNIGYGDHLQHRYWHFIDIPFSSDGTVLVKPPTPNVQTQIEAFRFALGSDVKDDIKSYDLVWLEHLVGDAHQPLHAASRFTRAHPSGDYGGTLVKVCPTPCHGNLHSFWDDASGASDDVASIINEAEALPEPAPDAASISDDRTWIHESFELAQNTAYSGPIGSGDGPYELNSAYKIVVSNTSKARIELAGVRLAALVNESLK